MSSAALTSPPTLSSLPRACGEGPSPLPRPLPSPARLWRRERGGVCGDFGVGGEAAHPKIPSFPSLVSGGGARGGGIKNPCRALGIDIGAATAKIAAVDGAGNLLWHHLEPTEVRVEEQVDRFLALARENIGPLKGLPLVATGYGRGLVRQAARRVTEITCHACGVFRELGHGGTLVDIGGQDSKVIAIGPKGEVLDFVMNDKCAAGTGRFLENTAHRLGIPLERMGEEALAATDEVSISSTCTVFAESEVVSLIAHGVEVGPILRGLHRALVRRVVAMIRTVGLTPPLMLSGGVVRNPAVRRMLEEETGQRVVLPRHPQLMGAYGAALLALENG